jgi:hypothetical protein
MLMRSGPFATTMDLTLVFTFTVECSPITDDSNTAFARTFYAFERPHSGDLLVPPKRYALRIRIPLFTGNSRMLM